MQKLVLLLLILMVPATGCGEPDGELVEQCSPYARVVRWSTQSGRAYGQKPSFKYGVQIFVCDSGTIDTNCWRSTFRTPDIKRALQTCKG